MSVILFSAAELADIAVAATTGPLYTYDSKATIELMAEDLAKYSAANVAAHNDSYPDQREPELAADILAEALGKDAAGRLELYRNHGANVVSLLPYNAVSQRGRDFLETTPGAAAAVARCACRVTRCLTADASAPAPEPEPTSEPEPKAEPMGRAEVIKRIKTALRKRSGRSWSVTGGRGTAWGWLRIDAPPARRKFGFDGTGEGEYSSREDREELAQLLGIDSVHAQGESIPSGSHYWEEYVDRAEGREPTKRGQIYWD